MDRGGVDPPRQGKPPNLRPPLTGKGAQQARLHAPPGEYMEDELRVRILIGFLRVNGPPIPKIGRGRGHFAEEAGSAKQPTPPPLVAGT
eukprot:6214226-Alexandrium_andersonii.AAC.1